MVRWSGVRFLPAALAHPLARLALLIGLAERIGWGIARHVHGATGEAAHVAVAWAEGRGFADAFMPGQGPTAHLMPFGPLVGGIVYRLFGVETMASEIVLFVLSQFAVFGTFLVFARCFERIGAPRAAILGGWIGLCVLPIYSTVEAFDFRIWEGAYGLVLGALALLAILSVDSGEPLRWAVLRLAILPSAAFFVNPPVGASAFAALSLLLWRRRRVLNPWPVVGGAALALAAMLGPWTVRNAIVMHHPIVLRDNLGLELAVANFPGAFRPGDFDRTFWDHLDAIHPRDHIVPYRAMQRAGGEVAYARAMGVQARAWIRGHPGEAALLWLRHVREMLFTRSWMFETAHGHWLPQVRAGIMTVIGLLGLAGIARRLGDRRSHYIALFVALPVLCYLPFQPIMRYTWLLYPPLLYFAADMVAALARRRRPLPAD